MVVYVLMKPLFCQQLLKKVLMGQLNLKGHVIKGLLRQQLLMIRVALVVLISAQYEGENMKPSMLVSNCQQRAVPLVGILKNSIGKLRVTDFK